MLSTMLRNTRNINCVKNVMSPTPQMLFNFKLNNYALEKANNQRLNNYHLRKHIRFFCGSTHSLQKRQYSSNNKKFTISYNTIEIAVIILISLYLAIVWLYFSTLEFFRLK